MNIAEARNAQVTRIYNELGIEIKVPFYHACMAVEKGNWVQVWMFVPIPDEVPGADSEGGDID